MYGPAVLKEQGLCPDRLSFQLGYARGALSLSVLACLGTQCASEAGLGVPVVFLLGGQLANFLLGEKNNDTNLLIFPGSHPRTK